MFALAAVALAPALGEDPIPPLATALVLAVSRGRRA